MTLLNFQRPNYGGLTDFFIKSAGLNERQVQAFENRDYFADNLDEIFKKYGEDERPNIPSGLVYEIIVRCASHLFPDDIKFTVAEGLEDSLVWLVEETDIESKLTNIAEEGMQTGSVGLKSIYRPELDSWTLDILPCETMFIHNQHTDPDTMNSLTIRYKFCVEEGRDKVEYWWQEEWTPFFYTEWIPQKDTPGQVPEFTSRTINQEASGEHGYGEIPVTVIQNQLECGSLYGTSEVTSQLKLYSRQLAIHYSKIGLGSQLHETPAYKRINDEIQDNKALTPGAIIDLKNDGEGDCDFAPIEHAAIPESAFEFIKIVRDRAFNLAQVTNPDIEKEMKAGGTVSSVAWKSFNLPMVKKIRKMRRRYGLMGVEAHLERIMRMAHALGDARFSQVDPEDLTKYKVSIEYPPFFEPTVEERIAEVSFNEQLHLPAETLAQRLARIAEIDDENIIKAIEAEITKEREMLEPTPLQM